MSPAEICLFPAFTQRVLRRLHEERRSVNLVGLERDGRRRVINDLYRLVPPTIKAVRVNCHDWRGNYPGLIETVWRGLGANHGKKKPPEDLAGLMDTLEKAGEVWLLLEEFDNLLDVPEAERDPRYNRKFFNDHLNSLKNLPNLRLLTVTAKPHRDYVFLCEGRNTSPPDLETERLPLLNQAELHAELQRRLPQLTPAVLELAAESLYQQPHGRYARLMFFAERLESGADAALLCEERFKRWQREFDPLRDKLNRGNVNRAMRWLLLRLRLGFNWAMALLLEVSLLRKLWEKLTKGGQR